MRKIHLIVTLILFFVQGLEAQEKNTEAVQKVKKEAYNLQIGDEVPDFKLEKIFNNARGTAAISDYRDRLLILDFGNTHCSGCIAALPGMDSLQKAFGNDIQIFWVTYEPAATIQEFWKRSKLTQNHFLNLILLKWILHLQK